MEDGGEHPEGDGHEQREQQCRAHQLQGDGQATQHQRQGGGAVAHRDAEVAADRAAQERHVLHWQWLVQSQAMPERLDLVWRGDPPLHDPTVAELRTFATVDGLRWSARLDQVTARDILGRLMSGAAMSALDDFTLATPSLEEVYLALGGRADDMERA